jgi:GNAT superfamily N-acetyltransferase
MTPTHFKRYRMQLDLRRPLPVPPPLLVGYSLHAWHPRLLEQHAVAKAHSFAQELDAVVFNCLASFRGCLQLMQDIVARANFAPEATWLVTYAGISEASAQPVATVQGVVEPALMGSIQNVGVVPGHRDRGLGSLILSRALHGFQQTGQRFATLEVTARNRGALRLYQRIGFEIVRTVYRSVDLALEESA